MAPTRTYFVALVSYRINKKNTWKVYGRQAKAQADILFVLVETQTHANQGGLEVL